ncbi:Methionine ABC transporter ATP-binding protein [Microbacterium esteraromaticum]|uniref:Methionine ABC transporter ATP-binding protein n=1 Tax=Microbacterium esteraromaticum TaxID=57043 RepID=A0A1R4KPD1_9MICO|nr:ATP-binding cassette domain-containing protein [Microbacterium esteraromaticum]SJN46266.1 Methionine ABC transporter ATP-binding protein [Microbacterium esteraromaticum]
MATVPSAIVQFDSITKRFRAERDEPAALDDITFSISEGEIFGIVGESGAGKSTLLELVNGLTAPTSGTVTVRGADVARLDRRGLRALRRDIGVVFQGVHLLSNTTVRDNVRLPLRLAARAEGTRTSRREQQRAVDEILAFVGLAHRADHFPAQLSGGERQRVGLARALVSGPPLLLCDEPTSSLDASTTGDVLRVLADAREKLGTTVIVITHDLDVVKVLCDRAALLEKGRLREVFPIARSGDRHLPSYYEQVKRELMS